MNTTPTKLINEPILCYLTPAARGAILTLTELGWDTDLALSFIEQVWAEHEIYSLDEPDHG
jgi:hypothetical protein